MPTSKDSLVLVEFFSNTTATALPASGVKPVRSAL